MTKTLTKGASARMLHALLRIPTNQDQSENTKAVLAKGVAEGKVQAYRIFSEVFQDDIWLILDAYFVPDDGLACYYVEEICFLKDKSPDKLRSTHKVKAAFPGCRVIQEDPEKSG